MNVLKITGFYSSKDPSPELTMADMLRYDDGELVDWTEEVVEGLRGRKKFVAEVHTNRFAPHRWQSFGLKAELVEKRLGEASCRFTDQQSVSDFIHTQSRQFD